MTNAADDLSPEASPVTFKQNGGKRANDLPLFLMLGAVVVFVAVIVMVAVKRTNQQHKVSEMTESHHLPDSKTMAITVIAGHDRGLTPSSSPNRPINKPLTQPTMINPHEKPLLQPHLNNDIALMDPERERIRLAKMQQFEEAVKAKTRIELPQQLVTTPAAAMTASSETTLEQSAQRAMANHQLGAINAGEQLIDAAPLGDRWVLQSGVTAPRTPYELRAGAVVPGIMISGVKSTLPGQIIGQVSQSVYDTATGNYLLIPQGTRLIGVYSSEVVYGQDSLLIAWQRLIFPDGKALDLGTMPGADSAGFTGFRDEINNHYLRTFTSALLMSGVTAGISYSQNSSSNPLTQPTARNVMSEALGQQLGQVTAQMIAKNLNLAPSLTIRPGFRFNIIVVKDLTFAKPYQPFDYSYGRT